MSHTSVFVYGTLMYPQVLQAIIKRVPVNKRAVVHGFQRYAIEGQVFPAVIPSNPDSQVQGLVLMGLSQQELEVLDEYEGEEYYKMVVRPTIIEESQDVDTVVDSIIYIWRESLRYLLKGSWDPEAFMETHLPSYTTMCAQFAKEYEEEKGSRPQSRPFGFK